MHPNYLGGSLMVALAACAQLIYSARRSRAQVVAWLAAGIVLAAGLAATLSRSAILGTLIGGLPILFVMVRQTAPRLRLVLLGGCLMAVLAFAAWIWIAVAGDVQTRFLTRREFFFADTFAVIQHSPVLGVGAGNLMWHVARVRDFTLDGNLLPVHNVYVYLWAEGGLPGAAFFVLALLALLRGVVSAHHRDVFVWSCGWLAIAVVMLFDNYWWAVHPYRVLLLWAVGIWWGLALRQRA
jgi:O-antigen ligase